MSQSFASKTLKFFMVASLVAVPSASRAEPKPIDKSVCSIVKSCASATSDAQEQANKNVDMTSGNCGGSGQLGAASASNAEAAESAVKACEKAKQQCKPDQNGCTAKDCKDAAKHLSTAKELFASMQGSGEGAAATGDNTCADNGTQPASSDSPAGEPAPESASSSGSGGSMMPALMAGAAGALLGYMLGKKKKEKDDDDSALLDNGQLDCSKDDASEFQGCNGVLETMCMKTMDDPRCQKFAARYCGGGETNALPRVDKIPPVFISSSSSAAATPGVPGEGMGSPFCRASMAHNYCKAGGRTSCPSCIQIERQKLTVCQETPALCLAQNSPADIAKAKLTCPTDPLFSDPAYLAGLNPGGSGTGSGGLPVVVLPGETPVGTTTGTSTTGNGSGAPAVVLPSSVATSTGSTGYAPSSATTTREVASVSGGPASDIAGQFGPSLFTVGTNTIRSRCASGKFNNCR